MCRVGLYYTTVLFDILTEIVSKLYVQEYPDLCVESFLKPNSVITNDIV